MTFGFKFSESRRRGTFAFTVAVLQIADFLADHNEAGDQQWEVRKKLENRTGLCKKLIDHGRLCTFCFKCNFNISTLQPCLLVILPILFSISQLGIEVWSI